MGVNIKTKFQLIAFLITSFFLALWIDSRLSVSSAKLPAHWQLYGPVAKPVTGAIMIPPNEQLVFCGIEDFVNDPFEIEVKLSVEEYDRIIFGFGTDESCGIYEIESTSPRLGTSMPPGRVNIVNKEDNHLLYHENGYPTQMLTPNLNGSKCFCIRSLNSKFSVDDFRIEKEGKSLHEKFLAFPSITARSLFIFPLLLIIFLITAWYEKIFSSKTKDISIRRASLRLLLSVLPLLITTALAPVSELCAQAVIGALLWFLYSRLGFIYRYIDFFSSSVTVGKKVGRAISYVFGFGIFAFGFALFKGFVGKNVTEAPYAIIMFIILAICWTYIRYGKKKPRLLKITISAGAVFIVTGIGVFLSYVLPGDSGGVALALAIVNLPFGAMYIISGNAGKVAGYNFLMFALFLILIFFMEAGLRVSPSAERLKPMNLGKDFEKHDILLWVPYDLFCEDHTIQSQNYTIPKMKFRSGTTSVEKPEGVFRIAVLGGSNTWGDGNDDPEKTFPAVIQRNLNQRGDMKFEVINAGVKGYDSLQVMVLLKHYIADYQPDVAVFYILRNGYC